MSGSRRVSRGSDVGAAGAPAARGTDGRGDPRVRAARERRRWQEFRRAIREARAEGAQAIRLQGIKVWLQEPPKPQPPSKPMEEATTEQTGSRQDDQPSARKRRSAARMQEFLQHKWYMQLAGCKLQRILLRAMKLLRWQRTQEVWADWMQRELRRRTVDHLIGQLREIGGASPPQLPPSPSPPPVTMQDPETGAVIPLPARPAKRDVQARSPDKVESSAAATDQPKTEDGSKRRALALDAGDSPGTIPTTSAVARTGLCVPLPSSDPS